MSVSAPLPAEAVLDRVFLEVRAKLLEVAASLDRLERADGFDSLQRDERLRQIRQTIDILGSEGCDRAERVQLLFSDPYVPGWSSTLPPPSSRNGHERQPDKSGP